MISVQPDPTISVVMPVYREGTGIVVTLREVSRELEKTGAGFEFVLVDDGSPDNTWSVLKSLTEEFPMLRAIRLSRNFGKELALCAGLEAAWGDAVIVMDADGQHPPSLLPEMIRAWSNGEA